MQDLLVKPSELQLGDRIIECRSTTGIYAWDYIMVNRDYPAKYYHNETKPHGLELKWFVREYSDHEYTLRIQRPDGDEEVIYKYVKGKGWIR